MKEKQLNIGILQPQLSYRWRLRVPHGLTDEEHDRVACHAESIQMDYINKKITITWVQNATDTILHEAIMKLVSKYTIILHIDSLNGVTATPNYILEFDCKPLTHNFALDYTKPNDVSKHTIEFEYVSMTPYNQKEPKSEESVELA